MDKRKRSKPNKKTRAAASGSTRDTASLASVGAAKPPDDAPRPPRAEADPALSASARPKRHRTWWVGVFLFAGVVVGAALYGLWPLIIDEFRTAPSVRPNPVDSFAPEPPFPEVLPPSSESNSGALNARLDALEKSLARLVLPQVAAFDALAERITALEADGGIRPAPETAALVARLDQLDAHLALGGTVVDDQPHEALAALALRLDALEADQTARLDPGVGSVSLVLGLAQLRDALARGVPFSAELAGMTSLLADRPDAGSSLIALDAHAEHGVSTREALRARFPALARDVVTAALAPEGAGWVDETLQKLADVVSVRRTGSDVEGDSAEARVARAEVHLAAGELAGAVAELEGLKSAAREAAQDWLSDARARLGAEDALARLGRVVAASLVAATDGAGTP